MLNQISVKNFKCFRHLVLPLSPLSLLTGFNAAGKSSSLQPLLLLAQTLRSDPESPSLSLNGPLARLGTAAEVLSSQATSRTVEIGVATTEAEVCWSLEAEARNDGGSLRITDVVLRTPTGSAEYKGASDLFHLLPRDVPNAERQIMVPIRNAIVLSAVRLGTADTFPAPDSAVPIHADVGIQGEYAPWWFERFLDEPIDVARCHPKESARTLRRQFNAWANELFPGAQANAQKIVKTSLMRLELRLGDTDDWQRPSNIGYGLTYAFPVLIAGLLADKGQILIVDSPEAHLHPRGQSLIGRFLAHISAAGVQVLIETHSDHVLNGIRVAVRDGVLGGNQVAIHFFKDNQTRADRYIAPIVSPKVDREGNLSEWPEGFFDQSENDLAKLAGWA